MSIFKCKMCGGTLEINENQTTAVCEYCGTEQTLSKSSDEVMRNLFNRANNLRLKSEFDKAQEIYEKIVASDNTDSEAYWGIVLCKYGIEYIEDPKTFKRVPTCHRTQIESVLTDVDYQSALEHADSAQKAIYQAEAVEIDRLQKDILKIASKEKPFDVFICYKESDEQGKRTADSVIANDIYHQLTLEGFKVFYAAITLEDKLGQEYEPYIFSALNSAKVMLVIGSKPEYFNAVWVKNEWSRFLKIVKNDRSKLLIPCYKDMDAYDLPEEFSHLQAQDMGKIGFINDVVRGIKKVISSTAESKSKSKATGNSENVSAPGVAPLLKRAFMFLEDGDWQSADEYCEKVLDQDPENAEAYLGKLMAELGCKKREELKDCDETFEDSSNYQKAVRFGSSQLKSELEGYIAFILDRNELERLNGIYNNAINCMQSATHESEFTEAAELFESINDFKDSKVKHTECLEKAEIARKDTTYNYACNKVKINTIASLENAIELYESILDWKDASEKIAICNNKIEELKVQIEKERIEKEKKAEETKKKTIKLVKIISPIVAVLIGIIIVLNTIIIPNSKYNKAMELYEAGKYMEALSLFIEIHDYKNTNEKISSINRICFQKTTISSGGWHTVGLKSDGTVVAVGSKAYGQCNVSNWTDIVAISAGGWHTVGLKSDGTVVAVGDNDDGQCNVSDWKDIVAISTNTWYTVGLKSDGTVVAVGDNDDGQCNVSDWTDIVAISAGDSYIVGLKSNGTVVAVGSNYNGQCDVSDWKDIVAISAGCEHTVGLKNDGTVVAVGSNYNGQCDVSDWKDIIAVSAGWSHTVGLKSDGTVVAVGNNDNGQCDVSNWKDIIAVSAGRSHTVGLKSDGTVAAVGSNSYGTVAVVGSNSYGQCDVGDWKDIKIPGAK